MKELGARPTSIVPRRHDVVDETSDESFPASDPPGWSLLHAGAPCRQSETRGSPRTPAERAARTPARDESK